MAAILNRSRRIESIRTELAAAFRAGRTSDEEIAAALHRYQDSGTPVDRDALASLCLGLVTMMAIRCNRRNLPNTELDDLISDGCFAVMRIIERFSHVPSERFSRMVCGAIKIGFRNGMAERMWAGGKRHGKRDNRTMLTIRSIFLKQHGRMPTGVELRAALDEMIQNGQIEKDFTRVRMDAVSVVADEDGIDLLSQLGVDGHVGPVYEIMGRETMKIAMRGLKGEDRAIFKMAVEGISSGEIATKFGISRSAAEQRVNGLLWAARCRADLAAHLGTEPAHTPRRSPYGRLVSIKSVPPARMAS